MPATTGFAIATLVLNIAKRLNEKNKSDPTLSAGSIPSEVGLANGIHTLIEEGLLKLNPIDIETPEVVSDLLFERVLESITKFQESVKKHVTVDGILGNQTLNFLQLPSCLGTRAFRTFTASGNNAPNASPDGGEDGDEPKLRYEIEIDSLPNIPDAIDLIADAWSIWASIIKLDIQEATSSDSANVVIRGAALDGLGAKLADADVGPPEKNLMEVRFDISETWTQDKFLYAAIHEFGHILGLHHTDIPGNIMFKRYQPDIEIGQDDIDRATLIWGARD
ncbi:matrixin family metalloprotease [Gimesia aquarii]|uniref:Matrixin n=1 Tax=Gimesia aquarii TaxID=2527964 RepID=A0A517X2U1_9PLAN|nr:matrixin family metalloprotease [Gimesia aquarii]QDU11814.1 Matrixin [Gimesia aquarii]